MLNKSNFRISNRDIRIAGIMSFRGIHGCVRARDGEQLLIQESRHQASASRSMVGNGC